MRRILTAALTVAAFAAVPATAQAQVSFGATAAYHVDAEALGVGAGVYAPLATLHENVSIMGEFLWFFPDGFDYFEINGNLLYDFVTDASVTPFALGGLTIGRTSVDTGVSGFDASSTDVGLNLGGGVTFGESSLRPQVGGRLELRDGSGFVIFGTVMLGGG